MTEQTVISAVEWFALASGVAYIILEILQRKAMWIVGIATGAACAVSFGIQHVYAQMLLNIYYVGVSVWGIRQWAAASEKLEEETGGSVAIHIGTPGRTVKAFSVLAFVAGTALMSFLLKLSGGHLYVLDAATAVLSAIATFWLARSYVAQWLMWVAADLMSTVLCLLGGMPWMALLYAGYAISAVYGWYHWKKHGIRV